MFLAAAEKRLLLNSIVHPLVIEVQDRWIETIRERDPDGVAVIEAALMIESGGYRRFDKIIVVWCTPDIQLRRLMTRNDLSANVAAARIAAQMPQEEKKKFADYLIDTSRDRDDTEGQTVEVFHKFRGR